MSELEQIVSEIARRVVREELSRTAPAFEWLSIADAADLLGCSEKALRGKLARGVLRAHKLDGRLYVSRLELAEAIRGAPEA